MGCVSYTDPAYGNSKGEAGGRSRHENNSERLRNMEGRNVGTIRRKSSKQDLTSAEDLTIELPEGRDSLYHGLD